jgi:hypothetical protein
MFRMLRGMAHCGQPGQPPAGMYPRHPAVRPGSFYAGHDGAGMIPVLTAGLRLRALHRDVITEYMDVMTRQMAAGM